MNDSISIGQETENVSQMNLHVDKHYISSKI